MNTEKMPISNNLQEEITFFFVQFRLLPPAQVKIAISWGLEATRRLLQSAKILLLPSKCEKICVAL